MARPSRMGRASSLAADGLARQLSSGMDSVLLREMLADELSDAFCRFAVPQRWDPVLRLTAMQRFCHFAAQRFQVLPYKDVGPLLHRDRPLCVRAQSDASHTEIGGLLLNAAGIRNYHACVLLQSKEFKIADRLGEDKTSACRSGIGGQEA